jgi:hypothetical protein
LIGGAGVRCGKYLKERGVYLSSRARLMVHDFSELNISTARRNVERNLIMDFIVPCWVLENCKSSFPTSLSTIFIAPCQIKYIILT